MGRYFTIERAVLKFLGIDLEKDARGEIKRRDASLGREIAGRFGRGNLSIQRGRFLMREGLERLRARVAQLHFIK